MGVLILGFFYTLGRSRYYEPGTLNAYYLIFIFGVVCCLIALLLNAEYRLYLFLSVFSILISIYLIEIYLLFSTHSIDQIITNLFTNKNNSSIQFDNRTKIQVIEDLRDQGIEAFPSIYPFLFLDSDGITSAGHDLFPLGGIANSETVLCNEAGYYVIYNSDEYGFNNPIGYYEEGNVDILIIGDSLAQGYCVQEGEDIGNQLRAFNYDVVNLGYGGNGPLLELATLREFGRYLKPDIVLWLYSEDTDQGNLLREIESSSLVRYLSNPDYSQGLINKQDLVNSLLINYASQNGILSSDDQLPRAVIRQNDNFLKQVIRLFHFRNWVEGLIANNEPQAPDFDLFQRVLSQAIDDVSVWEGEIFFVYVPGMNRYSQRVDQETYKYRDQTLVSVAELGIPIVDLHSQLLADHSDPLSLFPFRNRRHYTSEGYSLMAKEIYTSIENYLE